MPLTSLLFAILAVLFGVAAVVLGTNMTAKPTQERAVETSIAGKEPRPSGKGTGAQQVEDVAPPGDINPAGQSAEISAIGEGQNAVPSADGGNERILSRNTSEPVEGPGAAPVQAAELPPGPATIEAAEQSGEGNQVLPGEPSIALRPSGTQPEDIGSQVVDGESKDKAAASGPIGLNAKMRRTGDTPERNRAIQVSQSFAEWRAKQVSQNASPAPPAIRNSVGRGGVNQAEDVRVVQELLNKNAAGLLRPVVVSGKLDEPTVAAIREFQRRVLNMKSDGRVDPGGRTFKALLRSSSNALQ